MSLYKRKDSPVWWINLSVAGRKVQKSTGITLRRKAQEVHDQLATEMWQEARLGIKSKYSWDEAKERWLEEKAHKKSLATDREYLRWMQPHLQGKSLDSINRDDVERLIRLALKEKVQNSTVNRRMALLRAILRRAESDWEWIDKVPKFRFLKEPKGRVRFLTVEDAKRLLSELPEHLRVMTMFSLYSCATPDILYTTSLCHNEK